MKLRLTLQVKTSPDGGRSMLRSLILYHPSTCWAERQDWPPRRCNVHRWPRKRIQAEWSQFPWDAFSYASHKEFLQFNLRELYIIIIIYIYIYKYFLFVSLHVMPILWRHWHNQDLCGKSSYHCRGFSLDPIPPPRARVESTVVAWLAAAPRGYHRLR